jgi:hypothetical protein
MWKVNQVDDKAVVIKVNNDSIFPEITPQTWKVNQIDDKRCYQVQQITSE